MVFTVKHRGSRKLGRGTSRFIRRHAFFSISYYYLLVILILPHSLLNCTPWSLLKYHARSLLSLLWFSYGSSGFLLVCDGSHPPRHPSALSVVELYMYSLLTFPIAFNLCLRAALISLVRPNTVLCLHLVYTSLFS